MAGKANSGTILDLSAKFQKNKFQDKTVKLGDIELVFDGFISSKRGIEFNQLMSRGEVVQAFMSVMKNPDEALAQKFAESLDEMTPYGDNESMSELYDLILGRGARESDPNS